MGIWLSQCQGIQFFQQDKMSNYEDLFRNKNGEKLYNEDSAAIQASCVALVILQSNSQHYNNFINQLFIHFFYVAVICLK